ncbi:MAG TPA: hypothetical protein PKK43_07195 [Spirochaetota bacterium]|nr:hypothetical protein [Spirochaetota bacterium]
MKLTQNHLRLVIIILGIGLIALGLSKKFIGFELPERAARWIGTIVVAVAALVFLYSRKLGNIEQKSAEKNVRKGKSR